MRADGTPSGPDVPRRARAVLAGLERGLRDVGRLVLPVECPGCGRWDEVL
ncbi:MAG: hypothetical protein JWP95_1697, partial [Actinotalea sp.]|nr:hypothetical protein [Actinotalea sp.]